MAATANAIVSVDENPEKPKLFILVCWTDDIHVIWWSYVCLYLRKTDQAIYDCMSHEYCAAMTARTLNVAQKK